MNKIKTIFDRDWEGNRGVVNEPVLDVSGFVATEKVDGTNVRVTIRNHMLIRLEKRVLPSKLQKAKGIVDPWYMDADENAPNDKHIWEAARSTDYSGISDGEWSAEAYGEKIQGNPLQITGHKLFIFSHPETLAKTYLVVPSYDYYKLKEWLPKQKSTINPNVSIEGIVWWDGDAPVGKIKVKDFKLAKHDTSSIGIYQHTDDDGWDIKPKAVYETEEVFVDEDTYNRINRIKTK